MSSSDFLTYAQQSALHRETYTSVLKGLLPHGSARDFAENIIGISHVYLSNLLDPTHNPPSPEIAERIVAALPLDYDQRLGLLEHMQLAREQSAKSLETLPVRRPFREALHTAHDELRRAHEATVLNSATGYQGTPLTGLVDAGQNLLPRINPRTDPLIFVETCLILHNAQCALNQWGDALYLTRWADAVLSQTDPVDVVQERPWFDHLRINILQAEAVTYRNLHLPQRALDSTNRALHLITTELKDQQAFWLSHLYRSKIEILSRMPRFTVSEVEGLGDLTRALLETRAAETDAVALLLTDRALVNAWIRYDSSRTRKRAAQRLQDRLDHLNAIPGLGPLQRTMFLRTAARFYWRQGQHDEWHQLVSDMFKLGTEAGLRHQLSEVRREYGSALNW